MSNFLRTVLEKFEFKARYVELVKKYVSNEVSECKIILNDKKKHHKKLQNLWKNTALVTIASDISFRL